MTDNDGMADFEVPVRVLFRGPADTDPLALAEATDSIFENSTIRECFAVALECHPDPALNALSYDGYGMRPDPRIMDLWDRYQKYLAELERDEAGEPVDLRKHDEATTDYAMDALDLIEAIATAPTP